MVWGFQSRKRKQGPDVPGGFRPGVLPAGLPFPFVGVGSNR
jgi:hypothetical protein